MKKVEPVKFVLRVHPDLHERIVKLGQDNQRSLNNQTVVILDSWFDVQALRDRIAELERTVPD